MVNLDKSLASSESCGPFGIEFYSDAGEEIDELLFDYSKSGASTSFTVLYQEDEAMIGEYEIRYRVFLEEYPDQYVNSFTPFFVRVADPCTENTEDFPRPSRCPVE